MLAFGMEFFDIHQNNKDWHFKPVFIQRLTWTWPRYFGEEKEKNHFIIKRDAFGMEYVKEISLEHTSSPSSSTYIEFFLWLSTSQ